MTEKLVVDPNHKHLAVDDQLDLQALTAHDVDAMFNLTVENRDYLAEFLPWAEKIKTGMDSMFFIDITRQRRMRGREYGFGIFLPRGLVGHISLMHLKDGNTPEIGYWIAESESGKGITTKAAAAVTEFGFNTLNLDRILIRARLENVGSNKIAEKLGYHLGLVQPDEFGVPHNHWLKNRADN